MDFGILLFAAIGLLILMVLGYAVYVISRGGTHQSGDDSSKETDRNNSTRFFAISAIAILGLAGLMTLQIPRLRSLPSQAVQPLGVQHPIVVQPPQISRTQNPVEGPRPAEPKGTSEESDFSRISREDSKISEMREASREALEALEAVESASRSGVDFGEYSRRLIDAQIIVDRCVRSYGTANPLRADLKSALEHYELAKQLWTAFEQENSSALRFQGPLWRRLKHIPSLRKRLEPYEETGVYGGLLEIALPIIWNEASKINARVRKKLIP